MRAWGTPHLRHFPFRFCVSCFYITTVIHLRYPSFIKKNFILAYNLYFRDWKSRSDRPVGLTTGDTVSHLVALPRGCMEGREHIFKQEPKKVSYIPLRLQELLGSHRSASRKAAVPPQGISPSSRQVPVSCTSSRFQAITNATLGAT